MSNEYALLRLLLGDGLLLKVAASLKGHHNMDDDSLKAATLELSTKLASSSQSGHFSLSVVWLVSIGSSGISLPYSLQKWLATLILLIGPLKNLPSFCSSQTCDLLFLPCLPPETCQFLSPSWGKSLSLEGMSQFEGTCRTTNRCCHFILFLFF